MNGQRFVIVANGQLMKDQGHVCIFGSIQGCVDWLDRQCKGNWPQNISIHVEACWQSTSDKPHERN
jgi:hypothetical protein